MIKTTATTNLSYNDDTIKNNGFLLIDTFFTKHNWHKTKNETNWVSYTRLGDETTVFDISVDKTTICVSVPLKNSPYQYLAYFKDYFTVATYVERRFFDFIEN